MKDLIFELVDVSGDEMYFPLGIFSELDDAISQAEQHDPSEWDEDHEEYAVSEIRARPLGLSGNGYRVLWRCHWGREDIPDDDPGPRPWVHDDAERGTMEKPLKMCRFM